MVGHTNTKGPLGHVMTATLSKDNWVKNENSYTQDIPLTFIKEKHYPTFMILLSEDMEIATVESEESNYIYKVKTFDGHITAYANNPITVDLNFLIVTNGAIKTF